MRDLLKDPLCRAEDLGKPIPDSDHAISVALPLWEHVIGYEENDPVVVDQMQCGYPRFFYHPQLVKLFHACEERFAKAGEHCFAFPSLAAAQRCGEYIRSKTGHDARVDTFGYAGIASVTFDESQWDVAKAYLRFSGELVSSRLAESALVGRKIAQSSSGLDVLQGRLSELTQQQKGDVYLFPSGMAAVMCFQRMTQSLFEGAKSVQLEFPYVDVLKVQQEFGVDAHFIPIVKEDEFDALEEILRSEKIAAVYCEIPSNPLIRCVDLGKLSLLVKQYQVPLIVDDTVGTSVNVDVFKYADAVTTSLTKFFSGEGDIMAGSLMLNHHSSFYNIFKNWLSEHYENQFWVEDAEQLEKNSRDYVQRVQKINQTAETLFDYLSEHPRVDQVLYPKNQTTVAYHKLMKPGAGYGGLMSILLKDPETTSQPFYDALEISKGPSLGTNYSLVCPYMLLAHYDELDWAEDCGVSRYLIRISVGLETSDDLVMTFRRALDCI